MVLTDVLSLCLRIGELAFTSVVAGLNGEYLHQTRHSSANSRKRFIYVEVTAALGIIFSLLFLLPFASSFLHWPIDLFLFVGTMVAFGLLAHYDKQCGSVWNWRGITNGGACDKFKATIAFLFLASIFFLASAILGWWVSRKGRRTARVDAAHSSHGRRKWYRRY